MGEHKRQGKTFFVSLGMTPTGLWEQAAIHRSPSGHFTAIQYIDGKKQGKVCRISQAQAAYIMGWSTAKLLTMFKLD